jgi:uncharacterized protein YndB with AHSA1/START domain
MIRGGSSEEVGTMRPTDSGISYELSRTFLASPEALFDALTSAKVLKRTWGVQEIDVDARVGGRAVATYGPPWILRRAG